MLSREERIFSELLLARGLVARDFIEGYAKKKSGDDSQPSLADLLIDSGGLERQQAEETLEEARAIDKELAPHLEGGARLGEFLLVREIGRGGMGIVYEAEQESLGRRVALKVLPAGAALDERLAIRFQREARAAAKLQHPGIVPVFGSGRAEGVLFFAMELVEGRSLAELVAGGPLHPEEAARVTAEVARALEHAHAADLVHRDIKPENILLASDGRARLTDFGLVHDNVTTSFTLPHHVLGTPAYMAPEQALGHAVDRRSDIYALGAVLYTLLSGMPPYGGALPSIVLARVLTSPPPSVLSLRPGIPPGLAAICERAMARRPEDRYGSAAELASDLEAFGRGDAVAATRLQKRPRRLGWWTGIASTAAAGALFAAILIRGRSQAPVRADTRSDAAFALMNQALFVLGRDSRGVSRFDASDPAPAGEVAPADPEMVEPVDMTIGHDGILYVLEHFGGRILKYHGCTGLYLGDLVVTRGTGAHAIAFGPDGNLYLLVAHPDTQVWRFDPQGNPIPPAFVTYPIAGDPERIEFGPGGDLYVTSGDGTVYRFDAQGLPHPAPGQPGATFTTGVPSPTALAFDRFGNVYIGSDRHDPGGIPGSIYRYDTSGNLQSVLVAPGSNGLERPRKMVFGPAGELYVADSTGAHGVLRYSVPVGSPTATFLGAFGPPLPGRFASPQALVFAGNCKGPLCGDGIREAGEQCDDGNTSKGDLCDSSCQFECTGNRIVNGDFTGPDPVPHDGTGGGWTARARCGSGGASPERGNPEEYFWINSCGHDFEPDPDPYLEQMIAVGASSRCVLTGDYISVGRNNSPAGATDSFVVEVDGVPLFVAGPTATLASSPKPSWASFGVTFTATRSARVRIRAEANGSDNDFGVDNLFMCCREQRLDPDR